MANDVQVMEVALPQPVSPAVVISPVYYAQTGDLVTRNPAPNASPIAAPSGVYREYNIAS